MKNYILTEKDNNSLPLAIIAERENTHQFYEAVRKAIAENLALKSEDVSLNIADERFEEDTIQYEFDADIFDDGEDNNREYYLTECLTY